MVPKYKDSTILSRWNNGLSVNEVLVCPRFPLIPLMDLVLQHISKTNTPPPTPRALKIYLVVEVKLHGF
jgi:hypothetical protein